MLRVVVYFSLLLLELNAAPEVTLPQGVIRGKEILTANNVTYYGFEKIPYAAPPVGELRFQPPQAAPSWDEPLDTLLLDVGCFQQNANTDWETEDCLYLNIFTPELPTTDTSPNVPIMFYIHGGAFLGGSAINVYSDTILEKGVILVTINYRLGPFGFLSTQDDVIPGNNGLKDQKFALNWVYNNIGLFGGDPKRITIFGQSAGAASVGHQLLNQDNSGLIVGAILESGSPLCPWAYQRNAREIAFSNAAFFDSSVRAKNDSNAVLEVLLNVAAKELDTASEESLVSEDQIWQGFVYAPVIEAKNPDAFITKKMFGLSQAGNSVRVPLLIGINSEEASVFYSDLESFQSYMSYVNTDLSVLVPDDTMVTDKTNRTTLGTQIRDFYTGGATLVENLGAALRYSSDTSMTRAIIKFADFYSEYASTYFYQFSHDGPLSGPHLDLDGAGKVGHSAELAYLFCSGEECKHSDPLDQLASDRLVLIWTNFAKTQNPTPVEDFLLAAVIWPLVNTTGGDYFYVDIGNETVTIENHPRGDSYPFWNELYDNLGYSDFDTY